MVRQTLARAAGDEKSSLIGAAPEGEKVHLKNQRAIPDVYVLTLSNNNASLYNL